MGTEKKAKRVSGPQERALAAYVKLLRASESVQADAMRSIGGDLTPSQFGVLEALYHVGPMCLSVLAGKILKTSGNLTMVVGNLEKRGLVTRQQSAHDRRFVSTAITEKGKKLIARVFPQHATRITELMNRLSPREQEQLGELCRKLGKQSRAQRPLGAKAPEEKKAS